MTMTTGARRWGPARWAAAALLLIGSAVAGMRFLQPQEAAHAAAEAVAKADPAAAELKAKADKLFDDKNYKDAATAYGEFLKTAKPDAVAWECSLRQVQSLLRMQLFAEAEAASDAMIKRLAGTIFEARAERFAGNLYLMLPHYGTEQGGKFLRARYEQGRYVQTFTRDRNSAVKHLERARDLYAGFAADPAKAPGIEAKEVATFFEERIEATFDLAAAVSRFGPYDLSGDYGWGEEAEEEDGTVGEEDGPGMGRGRGRFGGGWRQRTPKGLPTDKDGNPVFDVQPEAYDAKLPAGAKLKYLLAEAAKLDTTAGKTFAARSVYRRAMLARARYGVERMQRWYWYDDGSGRLGEQVAKKEIWDLADDEVLTLLGSRLAVVKVPADEQVPALLDKVLKDYPDAGLADEARYARGLFFQTRKQYVRAVTEYEGLAEAFPQSKFVGASRSNIADIRRPEAGCPQTGTQLAGTNSKLPLTHRNATEVTLTAYTLDLAKLIEEGKKELEANPRNWRGHLQNLHWSLFQDNLHLKYRGKQVAQWTVQLKNDGTHRQQNTEIETPVSERGAYWIEGKVKGGADFQNVLLLTDLAVVEKKSANKTVYWTVDARTGRPVETDLEFFEYQHRWDNQGRRADWITHRSKDKTNDAGLIEYSPRGPEKNCQVVVTATTADGRMAFSGVNWWGHWYNPQREWEGWRAFMTTDRPVYRPGQTVHFKVWARGLRNGEYTPAGDVNVHVLITDPRGGKLFEQTQKSDAQGGVHGSIALSGEAPLGQYHVQVRCNGAWPELGGGQFRVEEYKKPEFEVTVDSAKSRAKLGEKIEAKISARYYFGAPVTDATVSYKIFREKYDHLYTSPGEWDWLYGWGYGRYWYAYDWFPGWGRWKGCCAVWYPWWGAPPKPARELVQEGEAKIAADGTLAVSVDTAKALRDHGESDHLYSIEAEVRDSSRRVINGSGSVKVTRQEFYSYVEADRGYYRPGEALRVKVRCLTPDNSPRTVKGKLTVAAVKYVGENNAKLTEEPVVNEDAETDADGSLVKTFTFDRSGQFRIGFTAKDAWGGTVEGATVVWVAGNDFDGTVFRFTDLEVITDKRSYKVGETARLMVNAKHAGATVLFSDRVDNGVMLQYKLLHLPKKSRIIEVPVTKANVPNFFVEATLVRDGKVHQEVREICVPPEQGMVDISVKTDKADYRPGAKGVVEITAKDLDGKPVEGAAVALTAFDRSVLYIQSETTPDIRAFFWGRKRTHHTMMNSTLNHTFGARYQLTDPQHSWHATPDSWTGSWGKRYTNFAALKDGEMEQLAGGIGGGFGGRERGAAKMAASGAPAPAAPGAAMANEGAAMADAAPGDRQNALRKADSRRDADGKEKQEDKSGGQGPSLVEPAVRKNFADTALWAPALVTGKDGVARAEITFPENLTAWKIKAYGMTAATRVGSAETSAVTSKNLLLRLQAPRFFVETDEVVLSANVHNYLKGEKEVTVSIDVNPEQITLMTDKVVKVKVAAGGEKRVDWLVKVVKEGDTVIRMNGLTDEESDAVEMTFPVLVHGIDKMVATVGSIRPDGPAAKGVDLVVPEERKPSATKLEVRFSPSLAGAMIDSLPYLITYPYGCTEQTMSRFLPAVVTAKTLQKLGVNLEDIRKHAANLNAQELGARKGERFKNWLADRPVFDTEHLNRVVKAGLDRLYGFQLGNGGWGWWANDNANPYLTAYVMHGLLTARECDVAVREDVIQRGVQALNQAVAMRIAKIKEKKEQIDDSLAFAAFVQSRLKQRNNELLKMLLDGRDHLALYGKALLCLANHKLGEKDTAALLLQNIRQFKEEDKENETVWFRTSQNNWWYWYHNDIETNAWVLKCLAAVDPKGSDAPGVVKWLLNNRRHGTYWRSTRDTATCVEAMADFMAATGETDPDYTLNVELDGKLVKSVKVDKSTFFTFDNSLTLTGDALKGGKHVLKVTREGKGAVYYSAYLSYFTKEQDIKGAGLEIKVDRKYFKLERVDAKETVAGSMGQDVEEKRLRWKRIELKNGDQVDSGDLIEVELKITSKNDYEFLCFEDYKPAGCEPTQLKSGARYGELCSNMELRDEKTVFFIGWLSQGDHLVKYRLRAEIPGHFHALPCKGLAMYSPELKCNSDEMRLRIKDK